MTNQKIARIMMRSMNSQMSPVDLNMTKKNQDESEIGRGTVAHPPSLS